MPEIQPCPSQTPNNAKYHQISPMCRGKSTSQRAARAACLRCLSSSWRSSSNCWSCRNWAREPGPLVVQKGVQRPVRVPKAIPTVWEPSDVQHERYSWRRTYKVNQFRRLEFTSPSVALWEPFRSRGNPISSISLKKHLRSKKTSKCSPFIYFSDALSRISCNHL